MQGVPSGSQTSKGGSLHSPRVFLPVGNDFTNQATNFLPAGKPFSGSSARKTKGSTLADTVSFPAMAFDTHLAVLYGVPSFIPCGHPQRFFLTGRDADTSPHGVGEFGRTANCSSAMDCNTPACLFGIQSGWELPPESRTRFRPIGQIHGDYLPWEPSRKYSRELSMDIAARMQSGNSNSGETSTSF